jgi:hypothetical protein
MNDGLKSTLLTALQQNTIVNGGYRSREAAGYRPDATAWAILALHVSGVLSRDLNPARACLAADQQADGRVSVSPDHPESYWPTCLAVLAWNQVPEFRGAQIQAVQFLLKTAGSHSPKEKDAPFAHDPSIRGWPWIEGTHSWVIPSSWAVIALKTAGYRAHERVQEASCLLLDRQLPRGGWNYGNTMVYGQELHPMVESTGAALSALAGIVPRQEIEPSLAYLKNRVAQVRTPLALSWSLLGLGAWDEEPVETLTWLEACWRQQERYGAYDTVALSLMILALTLPKGIPSLFGTPTFNVTG